MEKVIELDYTPRKWALDLHESKKRWNVLVLHRRAGKTTAVLNHLQRDALITPRSRYAYIGPTYKQDKNIAWDMLKEISRPVPGIKPNEQELKIAYPNRGVLQLFGSDNVDALRGIGLWGGAQDEASQQPSNLFSEVISKCLADYHGYWIWLGTPKGKNQFYETYQAAIKNPKEYMAIFRNIDDSLDVEHGEAIENLRKSLAGDRKLVEIGEMTEDEFQQEWYCSFTAAIKGAYYDKKLREARDQGRITRVPYEKGLPVNTWWDLGIGDATAIGFFQEAGKEVHIIDYYEQSGEGLAHYAKVLQDKGYVYGQHFGPHDIEVKELGTGVSRLETARDLGINFEIAPKLSIEEGINAVRTRFNTLWIDEEKCDVPLNSLGQYRKEWDDKRGTFRDRPLHDWTSHAADMLRYWAVSKKTGRQEVSSYTPRFREYKLGRFS